MIEVPTPKLFFITPIGRYRNDAEKRNATLYTGVCRKGIRVEFINTGDERIPVVDGHSIPGWRKLKT